MQLVYNTDTNTLQRGLRDTTPTTFAELLNAERDAQIPTTVYLVDGSGGDGVPASADFSLSLRRPAKYLESGHFQVAWGAGQSAAIDLEGSNLAARIEAALNADSVVDAAGGVDVSEMVTGRCFQIQWREDGARDLATVSVDSPQPSAATISTIAAGSATSQARQLLTLDEGDLAGIAAGGWSATAAPAATVTVIEAGSATVRTVTEVSISGEPAPGSYLLLNGSDPIPVDATAAEFAAKISFVSSAEKTGEYTWQLTNAAADNTAITEGAHNLTRWAGLSATLNLDSAEMATFQPEELVVRLMDGADPIVTETVSLSADTVASISGQTPAIYPRIVTGSSLPTRYDDSSAGYANTSKWHYGESTWELVDNTANAAVWELSAGDGEPLTDPPGSPTQVLLDKRIPTLAGVVEDESGNGNDGQLKGAPCGALGGSGSVPFAESILESLSEFTLSIYWRTDSSIPNNAGVIGGDISADTLPAIRVNSAGAIGGFVHLSTSGLESFGSAAGAISTSTVHHIVFTYDGSALTLYVDGTSVATSSGSGSTNATGFDTRIGGGQNASTNENTGRFWDARIYDTALTAAEVASVRDAEPITPEPVAWWPVCEKYGDTLHDVSGNGNHITLSGITQTTFWYYTQDQFFYREHYGATAAPDSIYTIWTPGLMDGSADADGDAIGTPAGAHLLDDGALSLDYGSGTYSAPDERTNPDFVRVEDGRASRLMTYATAQTGNALGNVEIYAQPNAHTIIDDGVWSWFADPRAIVQSDGTLLVGYGKIAGNPCAAVYDPATRTSTGFNLGTDLDSDDHINPAFAITADGKVLAAYALHAVDNYSRYRKSSGATVAGESDFAAEYTVDNGGVTTYNNLFPLDNGELWNITRVAGEWGYVKSTDNGATWTSWAQLYTSTNDDNCYSKFAAVGNRIWIAANNSYPNGYATSLFAFYIEGGNIYEPDGTLISTIAAAPITLENLAGTSAEVHAYTASAVSDLNDGVQSGRAWVWDMKLDGDCPVIAYHLEVLTTPTYASNGSTVYRDDADRHYYYRAKYTGGVEWDRAFVGHGGLGVSLYSPSYSGGITIAPDAGSDTYYFSTSSAEPTSRSDAAPGIVTGGGQSTYRATRRSDGRWDYTLIESPAWDGYSSLRPQTASGGGKHYLLFARGIYSWWSASDFKTSIVAIEIPEGAKATAQTVTSADETSVAGGAVSSVFGRGGAVVAASGDYTAAQITETATAKILTDAERTKLDGIETAADVTDASNVTAAGALMDSEVANLAQVKAFDSSDYATAAQGTTADNALQDVVDDTTPQLGANLDTNGKRVDFTAAATGASSSIYLDGSDYLVIRGSGDGVQLMDSAGTGGLTINDGGAASFTNDVDFQNNEIQNAIVVGTREKTQTLTDGATVSWNMNSGGAATLTLGGNRTISAPTNLQDGATYYLILKQDATGSRTVTWNAVFKWAGGTAPTLSTGANAIDLLTFVSDGTNLYGASQLNYS